MKKIQLMVVLAAMFATMTQSCSKNGTEGCIDGEACNVNTEAVVDDGSCTYALDWYQDLNGDGLGNPFAIITDCNQPSGYVLEQCVPLTFYRDLNNNGLGDPSATVMDCEVPVGYVDNSNDTIGG